MNQTFSFERFSLLVAKHWAENKKRYLLSAVAMIGLLIVWFLFIMLTDDHYPMAGGLQQVTYLFSLFGVGTFYASQYFKDLGSRSKASNFLLIPASSLEKLLCALFYVIVLFFIVFTAVFYLADIIMVTVANAAHLSYTPDHSATIVNVFTSKEVVDGDGEANFYFFLIFFTIQSAFLLGSIYFEKYSFIKTAISVFIISLSVFFLMYFFIEELLPNGSYHNGLITSYRIVQDGNDKLVQLPTWIGSGLKFLFMYAVMPLLWTATYFRLKEKQV